MTLRLGPFPAAGYPAWREAQVERRARWQFGPLWADPDAAGVRARAAVDALAPQTGTAGTELHRVLDGAREVGWVWLLRRDEELLVLDADVDAPAQALLELLEADARAGGATRLLVDRMAAAPTTTALVRAGGFTTTASNLALPLATADLPQGSAVRLVPMTPASFETWVAGAVESYARELYAAGGGDLADARRRAREQHDELLPRGLATEGQRLFDVVEARPGDAGDGGGDRDGADDDGAGAVVGMLWIGLRPPSAAFVYDVEVRAEHRGRGLGRATMRAAARWCRDAGLDVLGLNVFGHNTPARSLYDSLGYEVVVAESSRPLPPA